MSLRLIHVGHAMADLTLFDGVDVVVASGERVGLVGDNGAGKSTLLRIAAGALAPDRGQVRVDGTVALLTQLDDRPAAALAAPDLLSSLRARFGMSVLLITHDMGAVARLADRLLVMYAGRAAEVGGVREVFAAPRHPYTRALLRSMPRLDLPGDAPVSIPGSPPVPSEPVPGCAFHPRCERMRDICARVRPEETVLGCGRRVACHFALQEPADV